MSWTSSARGSDQEIRATPNELPTKASHRNNPDQLFFEAGHRKFRRAPPMFLKAIITRKQLNRALPRATAKPTKPTGPAIAVAVPHSRTTANAAVPRTRVVFCPSEAKTEAYYNGRIQGEVDDATLCAAIMNVWLHPASQNQVLRKSLLTH